MSKQLTTIQTRIDGEQYVATTPHAPELSAAGASESQAVNSLIAAIRQHCKQTPTPWIVSPKASKSKDIITRKLSGLWPSEIKTEPTPDPAKDTPALTERNDDGN